MKRVCTICTKNHPPGTPCWPFGPSKDEGSEDDCIDTRTVAP